MKKFIAFLCFFSFWVALSACGLRPEVPTSDLTVGATAAPAVEIVSSDSTTAPTAFLPTPTSTPTPSPTPSPTSTPKPDWVTVFVAFENYHEGEFEGVKVALDEAGYKAVITSTQTGTADGMGSGHLQIDKAIDGIEDLGLGIIIVGGTGVVDIWDNEVLLALVRRADEQGLLVAGICAGPGVLGNAGVLEGKSASWYNGPNTNAVMRDAGCENSGQAVTVDGNAVTGNGPAAAEEFGEAVVSFLDLM